MSHTYCHRCNRMMASASPFCPHCGAPQDERSKADSTRRNVEIWMCILPAVGGVIGGWLLFSTAWAAIAGLVVGLAVGIGIVAVRSARRA